MTITSMIVACSLSGMKLYVQKIDEFMKRVCLTGTEYQMSKTSIKDSTKGFLRSTRNKILQG